MKPVLTIKNVRKSFGPVEVLRGVDLEVLPGEVLALVGDNGAGKTTKPTLVKSASTAKTYTPFRRAKCASAELKPYIRI